MGLLGLLLGKTRCPACGHYGRNPRDLQADQRAREARIPDLDDLLEQAGFPTDSPNLVCAKCSYGFKLEESRIWQKIGRQLGEKRAVDSYAEVGLRDRNSERMPPTSSS